MGRAFVCDVLKKTFEGEGARKIYVDVGPLRLEIIPHFKRGADYEQGEVSDDARSAITDAVRKAVSTLMPAGMSSEPKK